MLYMTVWAIKHRTFVNNFAYETAEINIEVKHLLNIDSNRCQKVTIKIYSFIPTFTPTFLRHFLRHPPFFSSIRALFRADLTKYIDFLCTFL